MSVEFNHSDYTTSKQILVFPDHYVGLAHRFVKQDPVATQVDGRYIIKAGTIYPANDQTAIGVVMNDYDVTNGDITGTILVHGFIKTAALPEIPTANAKGALKQITFFPLQAIDVVVTGTKVTLTAGEASGTEHDIVVGLSGASFRPEATQLSKWTISGDSTTKVSVESITVAPDGSTAVFHTKNSASAVAGDVTVLPDASVISTGDAPSDAFTIVTVA